jgi:hypothetical protein
MPVFQKGQGGRKAGARNKISAACLNDALESYQKNGKAAWEILFHESPRDYLRAIIALLPQELEISDNRLKELSDEELETLIAYARKIAPLEIDTADPGSREGETAH